MRKFKVLDSSGLAFGRNFDGNILEFVGYHDDGVILRQPGIGVVVFDPSHVEEVVIRWFAHWEVSQFLSDFQIFHVETEILSEAAKTIEEQLGKQLLSLQRVS